MAGGSVALDVWLVEFVIAWISCVNAVMVAVAYVIFVVVVTVHVLEGKGWD